MKVWEWIEDHWFEVLLGIGLGSILGYAMMRGIQMWSLIRDWILL